MGMAKINNDVKQSNGGNMASYGVENRKSAGGENNGKHQRHGVANQRNGIWRK